MRSPSFLRSDSFYFLQENGEDEQGNAIINRILIKKVRIDLSYGLKKTQKGILTDDKILITIDVNDYDASLDERALSLEETKLKIEQQVEINKKEYTVTAIKPIKKPNGKNILVEVYVK